MANELGSEWPVYECLYFYSKLATILILAMVAAWGFLINCGAKRNAKRKNRTVY